MLKKLILISTLFLLLGFSLIKKINWEYDFFEAQYKATIQQKLILVSFSGSDWCAPCMRLQKEVFEDSLFIAYADSNFIMVKADFPQRKANKLSNQQLKHNEQLAEKYNPNGVFPLIIITDSVGTKIGELGYVKGGTTEFLSKIKVITNK